MGLVVHLHTMVCSIRSRSVRDPGGYMKFVFIVAKDGSSLRKDQFLADAWTEDLKKKMLEADISTFRAP